MYFYIGESQSSTSDGDSVISIGDEITQEEVDTLNKAFSITGYYHAITQIRNIVIENGLEFQRWMKSDNLQVHRTAPDYYHPGRSGALCLGKEVLAYFGELHPAVLKAMDVKEHIVACEVFLNRVPTKVLKTKNHKKLELSQFQPVRRDFAFIMQSDVNADKLIRAVKGVDKKLITDVKVFDVYEGANMEGKKSIALEVVFEPMEKTLTDAELETLSTCIINAASGIGAELRK